MDNDYVLRERDDAEIYRLKFQHEVWRNTTDIAIQKAAIKETDTIIDLGSGPGYLSYDILKLLNQQGKIYCVDNSEKFIDFINAKNISNLSAVNLDIRKYLFEYFKDIGADKIFCRWVLMFNEKTDKIIYDIYQTLNKGGKFISLEYFNFQQINIFPQNPIFNKIYKNVEKLIMQNGGDPNTGNKVYSIMQDTGFRNIELYPVYNTGRVNSPFWQWLEKTNANHSNLVDAGLISQSELEQYHHTWQERAKLEYSFITAPPLMITIGEK